MPVVLVANPKGGVGKSTLATNIAGYFARQGYGVLLGDVDRQQSSRIWLGLRNAALPPIVSWEIEGNTARPPKGTTHAVLDTPAGFGGEQLTRLLKITDSIIVPLQPSMFDIMATRDFLQTLAELKALRDQRVRIGIVGMRADIRTKSADQLARYMETIGLPVLGMLRDTQNYVQLAAHGLTLFDVAPSRVEKDLLQWEPLIAWLENRT